MDSLVSRHITIKSPAEQEKMRVAGAWQPKFWT